MNSKNFKNGITGLYTTEAKYLHNKLRINFSMSPSLKYIEVLVILILLLLITYVVPHIIITIRYLLD